MGSAMARDLNGYLNVFKPPGITSHDVIRRLRRLTGLRRIGHAGTLDPAAVGVLPVALGRATRTLASRAWDAKLYLADVRLGAATDTDDAGGAVVATGTFDAVDEPSIQRGLTQFVGDIRQRPPAYSAVHTGGGRAYMRARRGQATDLPARMVRVDAVGLVAWARPVLTLLVQCRSGTYVRSIARDFGSAVGCPAHLDGLVRLRVGPFRVEDALGLETLALVAELEAWDSVLWPADVAAWELPAIIAPESRALDLGHGRPWRACDALGNPRGQFDARVYDAEGALLGFARRSREGLWHPLRGISPSGGDSDDKADPDA